MTKEIFICTAAFGAAFLLCAADRREDGNNGRHRGGSIVKMRQVTMPQPHRFERPDYVVNDKLRPVEPKRFETGEPIKQWRETRPPVQHATITHNEGLVRSIQSEQRGETLKNHYYWHNASGVRYTHFHDNHNIHWYGFYNGPRFYWSRYYENNWWWYDGSFARWVFWWDGYWWWWGPGGIAFVYIDNNYYPYDTAAGAVVVQKPEAAEPPKDLPSPGEGQKWISADKSRMVQIHGDGAEAFLYDNSGMPPVYLAYLGRDVVKARFSEGSPAQILVDFKDGTFALYDMDGKPQKAAASKPPDVTQPPAPESVPSPPTSAPGQ